GGAGPPGGRGPPIALPRQVEPVDRVNDVEEGEGISDLVGLQMPDQMPGDRASQDGDLLLGLLNAILAEGGDARGHRTPDAVDVNGLGYGDEPHILGASAGA